MALTDASQPPPPGRTCADCGTPSELLTQVHVRAWNDEPERDILLCPACLTDQVITRRHLGGRIEAHLEDGRVVRW